MEPLKEIQGWLTEGEANLLKRFASEQQKDFKSDLLEIGSWKGRSGIVIASVLKDDHRLWMIDHFYGGPERTPPKSPMYLSKYSRHGRPWAYPIALMNVIKFGVQNRVIILPLSSEFAARVIDEKFCFIFIDGNHTYRGVSTDWNLWSSYLEIGGVCLFHDCHHPPIKKFLDELEENKNLRIVSQIEKILVFKRLA